MILQLTFAEVNAFLKHEARNMEIKLSFVDEKTLNAHLSKWFISKDIQLSIDQIISNDIYLSIHAGEVGNALLRAAVTFFKRWLPPFVNQAYDTSFIVHLDKIEPVQIMLNYMAPKRVQMQPDGLIMEAFIK